MRVELSQLVDDVMRQCRPVTIRVFLDYKIQSVGCPIACFHTIEDACREHEVDRVRFLTDIRAAAATGYVDDPSC